MRHKNKPCYLLPDSRLSNHKTMTVLSDQRIGKVFLRNRLRGRVDIRRIYFPAARKLPHSADHFVDVDKFERVAKERLVARTSGVVPVETKKDLDNEC